MAIVEVDKLVKCYKGAQTNAVDGVSFSIEPGEFFAMLGPNGAGKTTTINLPWYLDLLSRISPLRYAVDLVRGVYYAGQPDYARVVLDPPLLNLTATGVLFVVFLGLGTFFVRAARTQPLTLSVRD